MKFGITVTKAVSPAITPAGQADSMTRAAPATEESGLDSASAADGGVERVGRFADETAARA